MLALEVVEGPDAGRVFPLPPGEPQLIGRSSEALLITDPTVSRRHAELTPDGDRWYLRDIASSNGTFLNGRRLEGRIAIRTGDEIGCGASLLRVARQDALLATATIPDANLDTSAESIVLASPHSLQAARIHLRLVLRLTAATAGSLSEESILHHVVSIIADEFRPDRTIGLLIGDGGHIQQAIEVVGGRIHENVSPFSKMIVEHACRERTGILIEDIDEDVRFSKDPAVAESGLRSALCAPLIAHDQVLGAILIESHESILRWAEEQLELLTAAATHAALALLTAELLRTRLHQERLAAMGQTVASISHSVKNILQGLRSGSGAVELALNKGNLDLAREGWPILLRNLDRVYALTFNMLAWSRSSRLEISMAQLEPIVHEAASLVAGACQRRRVAMSFAVERDLPPIPIDEHAILQVLLNLLNNAIEAVPSNTGKVELQATMPEGGEQVVIAISDNGPGIDLAMREQVFEAFRSTKGQRGTGLGLAVTRQIVTEHGGTITIEDVAAAGTRIIITLPLDREEDPDDTRGPRQIDTDAVQERFDDDLGAV